MREDFRKHDLGKLLLPEDWWLVDAVYQAIDAAGLDRGALASERSAVIANFCGPGRIEQVLFANRDALAAGRPAGVDPMSSPRTMSSSISGIVAILLGIRGAAFTVGMGCAGGLAALDVAAGMIRKGEVDRALVVGLEALSLASYVPHWSQLGASPRSHNAAPHGAMRYAAADREGIAFSEGSACLVLERAASARARQAWRSPARRRAAVQRWGGCSAPTWAGWSGASARCSTRTRGRWTT